MLASTATVSRPPGRVSTAAPTAITQPGFTVAINGEGGS
jgi:hypothetical protein